MTDTTVSQIRLCTPLKSPAGNIIAAPGVYEAVRPVKDGVATIRTPNHYAGAKTASFPLRKTDIVGA